MGAGLLYHLAEEGCTDALLIEKGELTSGSTWHAAGLCPHFIGDLTMAHIHNYGTQLYPKLEELTGQPAGWHECGGIRLAKPADQIRLGEVIRDIEQDFELAECFKQNGDECPLVMTCGLNEALSRALHGFFGILNEYTIADLTQSRHNINVLTELNKAARIPLAG